MTVPQLGKCAGTRAYICLPWLSCTGEQEKVYMCPGGTEKALSLIC